ncbi:MAG: L-aspartate oxidase [Lachnospiraceae bacterium]|nr:L-aspartate oxidase [Lachnospiraceae bacterium]
MKTDILIIGSGCAGLYCALNLPKDRKITVITKADAQGNDSFLAQGGMCMLKDEADYASFFEDTMKAGHYENDRESVDIMIRSSQAVVEDLVRFGADFQKDENGELVFTKEGAHSAKRILFHEDVTGREITSTLLDEVRRQPHITLLEYTTMIDLIEEENVCYGAILLMPDGQIKKTQADYTVMATGGIGGLYKHSTNFRHLTGDALAVAIRHGLELKDISYVQIHPTTLYSDEERSFLISESVRGEGAVLRDKNGNRFVNELLPRDLLTKEILKQMEKDGTEFVWEDLRTIPRDELESHFPNIIEHCRKMGYDVTKECIPVVPAQHYFMGGVKVNHQSRTSMEQLYAVGETACNGVHGRNRLASNSLLESLVFAKRAAQDIADKKGEAKKNTALIEQLDLDQYQDIDKLCEQYHTMVKEEIEAAAKCCEEE